MVFCQKFLEMIEVSLSGKMIGNVLLPVIKLSFQAQIRILEMYLPGLDSFPKLKNLSDETSGDVNECVFFDIVV